MVYGVVVVVVENYFAVFLVFFVVEVQREFDPNRGSVGINGCERVMTTYANFNRKWLNLATWELEPNSNGNYSAKANIQRYFDTLDTFQGNIRSQFIKFLQLK